MFIAGIYFWISTISSHGWLIFFDPKHWSNGFFSSCMAILMGTINCGTSKGRQPGDRNGSIKKMAVSAVTWWGGCLGNSWQISRCLFNATATLGWSSLVMFWWGTAYAPSPAVEMQRSSWCLTDWTTTALRPPSPAIGKGTSPCPKKTWDEVIPLGRRSHPWRLKAFGGSVDLRQAFGQSDRCREIYEAVVQGSRRKNAIFWGWTKGFNVCRNVWETKDSLHLRILTKQFWLMVSTSIF